MTGRHARGGNRFGHGGNVRHNARNQHHNRRDINRNHDLDNFNRDGHGIRHKDNCSDHHSDCDSDNCVAEAAIVEPVEEYAISPYPYTRLYPRGPFPCRYRWGPWRGWW